MFSLTVNKFYFSILLSFCLYNLLYNLKPLIKAKSDLHIYDLKINHLSCPLGIDITQNSFSFLSDKTGPFKVSLISKKTNQTIQSKKIFLENCNSFYFKKPLEYQSTYIYRVEDNQNINELEFETTSKLDSMTVIKDKENHDFKKFADEYIKTYKPNEAIRITQDNFCIKKGVRYIPMYATFCLSELV